MLGDITSLIILLPVILVAISLHEFAHAKVADILGDPTPRHSGRLTLNPLSHIDPIGFIMLILVRFGWASPVPINPYNFGNPRQGILWVSLAGPVANFSAAWLVGSVLRFTPGEIWQAYPIYFAVLSYFVWINLALGVFNLIPIPPLDGAKILESLLPPSAYHITENLNRYGFFLLMILILGFQPVLSAIISLLFNLLTGG